MKCTYVKNIDGLAIESAEHIYQSYLSAIEKNGYFTFIVSGGNTPKFVFIQLIKKYLNKIEWGKVHFFWVDERCVEYGNIDSNYRLANDYLLKYIAPGSTHRIMGELTPMLAARSYEKSILNFFLKNVLMQPSLISHY